MTEPTEPVLEGDWTIRASTSRFFTVRSGVKLAPTDRAAGGFELEVDWEKQKKVKLIEKDFHEVKPRTLRGTFPHPGEPGRKFELVVTLCPEIGPDGKKYLFGLLFPPKDNREDEGTGVWVAEAQPPIDTPRKPRGDGG
ncbi:MAG TPA: hypothetical protein VNW71_17415 [Thermoanaerobaculia bacterium]|nr:hypothetical protein [Thermoanaerobaculia bacterium]